MDNEKIEAMARAIAWERGRRFAEANGLDPASVKNVLVNAHDETDARAVLPIATANMIPVAVPDEYAELVAMIRDGETGQIDVAAVVESLASTVAALEAEAQHWHSLANQRALALQDVRKATLAECVKVVDDHDTFDWDVAISARQAATAIAIAAAIRALGADNAEGAIPSA